MNAAIFWDIVRMWADVSEERTTWRYIPEDDSIHSLAADFRTQLQDPVNLPVVLVRTAYEPRSINSWKEEQFCVYRESMHGTSVRDQSVR
jgi:hypothetical protein